VTASARGGRERSPDPLIEKPSTITGPVSRVLSVNGSCGTGLQKTALTDRN